MVSPEEGALSDELWERLHSHASAAPSASSSGSSGGGPSRGAPPAGGAPLVLRRGDLLHGMDRAVRQFYVLLEVRAHLLSLGCPRDRSDVVNSS